MPHICTTDVLCEGRRGASWCAGSPAGGAPGKERVCQGGVPAESWVSWAGAQGGRDNQDFMVSEVDEGHVQTRMGMGCGVHALIIQVSLPGRKTGSMVGEAPSLGRRGAAVHRGHQEAVRGGWLGGSQGASEMRFRKRHLVLALPPHGATRFTGMPLAMGVSFVQEAALGAAWRGLVTRRTRCLQAGARTAPVLWEGGTEMP